MKEKHIKDFEGFEISNPEHVSGGISVDTKACFTIEVKACVTLELKQCLTQEVHCPSPFSVRTTDGGSVGW